MKTLFNNVLKSGFMAVLLSASLFSLNASAAVNMDKVTPATEIKKVVVKGNTNVIIMQNPNESVNINDADMDKVALNKVGNTLTITSTESMPVTVVVYVKDIFRIDATDEANVSTEGKFNVKNLQVIVRDHANAHVKAHTESLYTVVGDHATLDLKGSSDNHIYKMDGLAKMDTKRFAATNHEDVTQSETVNATATKDSVALSK